MTLAHLISVYMTWNILLVIGFTAVVIVQIAGNRANRSFGAASVLKLHYWVLSAIFVFMGLAFLAPGHEVFSPIAKIAASSVHGKLGETQSVASAPSLTVSFSSRPQESFLIMPSLKLMALFFLGVWILGLGRLFSDLGKLRRIGNEAHLIRRVHRVRIFVSEKIRVPFSYWTPAQAHIVLPETLLGTPDWKSVVLHELQHHRQGDTRWVYLTWLWRGVFFPNPLVHLWARWLSEIQEFACDETLVDQEKVDPLAYARCLLKVAQTSVFKEDHPVCATGLNFFAGGQILKRRITQMLQKNKKSLDFKNLLPVIGILVALLATATYASQGLVQDRRVTLAQAQSMANSIRETSPFPAVANPQVVKWLNYYLGSFENREKMKAASNRMATYRPLITKKLAEYQMPEEFLALPLIESGYQNLEPKRNPVGAAGLWQFIASTARNFNLKVDGNVDERLQADLETDAAMRLLLSNKLRFNDWGLSILSYNAGDRTVQDAITKTRSRDPWVLVQSGFTSEESANYLPKLMAAILILKNPSIAD